MASTSALLEVIIGSRDDAHALGTALQDDQIISDLGYESSTNFY